MEGLGHEEGGIDVFGKITHLFFQIWMSLEFIFNGLLIFIGSLVVIFLVDLIPLSTLGVNPRTMVLAFNIIKIIRCSIYLIVGILCGRLIFNRR